MSATDYLDVPDDFYVLLPITYQDRIDAVCLDQHYCTIANAICRTGRKVGILMLAARGTSRTYVDLLLDPKVWPWAIRNQVYRARFTDQSAFLALELDDWHNRPKAHARHKQVLRRAAAGQPKGLSTIWDTVTLVAPTPSRKKGYRSGSTGMVRGSGPQVPGTPARRYDGAPRPTVAVP